MGVATAMGKSSSYSIGGALGGGDKIVLRVVDFGGGDALCLLNRKFISRFAIFVDALAACNYWSDTENSSRYRLHSSKVDGVGYQFYGHGRGNRSTASAAAAGGGAHGASCALVLVLACVPAHIRFLAGAERKSFGRSVGST